MRDTQLMYHFARLLPPPARTAAWWWRPLERGLFIGRVPAHAAIAGLAGTGLLAIQSGPLVAIVAALIVTAAAMLIAWLAWWRRAGRAR